MQFVLDELSAASEELSALGLLQSAKWAYELLTELDSMPDDAATPLHAAELTRQRDRFLDRHACPMALHAPPQRSHDPTSAPSCEAPRRGERLFSLAKSYFDLRQFQRCASSLLPLLPQPAMITTNAGQIPSSQPVPAPQVSERLRARARFLRAYALFLNCEKSSAERASALHSAALVGGGSSASGDPLNPSLQHTWHQQADEKDRVQLQLLRSELCRHLYGSTENDLSLLSVRPAQQTPAASRTHRTPSSVLRESTISLPSSSSSTSASTPASSSSTPVSQHGPNNNNNNNSNNSNKINKNNSSSSLSFSSSSFSVRLPFHTPSATIATTPAAAAATTASASINRGSSSTSASNMTSSLSTNMPNSAQWVQDELSRMQAPDGLLLYLLAMILKRLQQRELAKRALVVSLTLAPVNWSAWQLLADLCDSRTEVDDLLAEHFRTRSSGELHWMAVFFRAHVLLALQENEECAEVLKHLHPVFAHTTALLEFRALVHYQQRDYEEAERYFAEMRRRHPYRLQSMDVFSNILYVTEKKAELSHLAMDASRIDYYRPETCCILGNYYSLKMYHEKAVLYFQRALKLNPNYLSAWTLMGHEYVEMKNTKAAIYAYRKAIDINARDYRAWYGLGQMYEILYMPMYALFYYRKAAALRPYDARMWTTLGVCYESLAKWNEAVRCYERAIATNDCEGLALHQLAIIHREQFGDRDAAAEYYQRMLDRHDVEQMEGPETLEALEYLAHYYKDAKYRYRALVYAKRLQEFSGKESNATALVREIINMPENELEPLSNLTAEEQAAAKALLKRKDGSLLLDDDSMLEEENDESMLAEEHSMFEEEESILDEQQLDQSGRLGRESSNMLEESMLEESMLEESMSMMDETQKSQRFEDSVPLDRSSNQSAILDLSSGSLVSQPDMSALSLEQQSLEFSELSERHFLPESASLLTPTTPMNSSGSRGSGTRSLASPLLLQPHPDTSSSSTRDRSQASSIGEESLQASSVLDESMQEESLKEESMREESFQEESIQEESMQSDVFDESMQEDSMQEDSVQASSVLDDSMEEE